MGWMEGLISGYADRHREIVDTEALLAREQQQRENDVMKLLLNSEDPKVRAMAGTGLLMGTQPQKRRGGVRGWMGEMEANPLYHQLLTYSQTPQEIGRRPTGPPGIPSARPATSTALPTPPQQNPPAALPEQSPTEPGASPLAQPQAWTPPANKPGPFATSAPMTSVTGDLVPPPTMDFVQGPDGTYRLASQPTFSANQVQDLPQATPPPVPPPMIAGGAYTTPPAQTEPIMGLPQMFPSIEALQIQTQRGQALGDVRGKIKSYKELAQQLGIVGDKEQSEFAARLYASQISRVGGSNTYQAYPIQYPDATGRMVTDFAQMNRVNGTWTLANGQPLPPGTRPRSPAISAGGNREAAASFYGYARFADVPTSMVPTVIAKANQIAQDTAYATGTGAGDAAFDRRITPVQSTVTGIPIGTRGSALLDQVAPNMAQLERRRSIQNLYQQLLHIGNDLLGVLPRASELGGKVPGATIAARRVLPGYREGFAALDAAIDNIVNVMARSVGEQKGAQTEQDAERAYNTIAQLRSNIYNPFGGDTWESAAARLNETIGHLENVYAGMPGPVVPGSPGNWRPGTPPPAPPTGLGAPGTTPIQGMPPEWEWGPNGEILHFGEPL